MKKILILAAAFLVLGAALSAQENKKEITAPGARLEKLAGDFKFTEGPACDARGNVYFTDQPNDRIMVWSADGKLSTFLQPSGRANGLTFDRQGNLWACADEKNEMWIVSANKKIDAVIKNYQGKLLNGPNDVWVRPDGGVYFTDPLYRRPYWPKDAAARMEGQYVFFLAADRKTLRPVATDLKQPNGIIGTPDGKLLYVADIGDKKTYRYEIRKDGTLANRKLFCEMGSDGMTVDAKGNVYLTGRGVTVFDRKGAKIQQIEVPEKWTANICFGGADRRLLFITASTGVYGIRTKVKGAGSQ